MANGDRKRPPPVVVADSATQPPPTKKKSVLLAPAVTKLETPYGGRDDDDAGDYARARANFDLDPDAMVARHDLVLKEMKVRIDALVAEAKQAHANASPRRSGSFSANGTPKAGTTPKAPGGAKPTPRPGPAPPK